jgi:hypothetical protein
MKGAVGSILKKEPFFCKYGSAVKSQFSANKISLGVKYGKEYETGFYSCDK